MIRDRDSRPYVFDLRARKPPRKIGNKALGLRFLADKGFPVPRTHVCTWEAFEDHAAGVPGVLDRVRNELDRALDPAKAYAVRSSANLEDSLEHSFAGQFETILGRRGAGDIVKAVRSIWLAVDTEPVRSYLGKTGKSLADLKMAVVVQEMVEPVLSGVSFSKNPITGLDEIVIEAVSGSGTALVQGGKTPYRWVEKWGGWIETPESSDVPLDLVRRLADGTRSIARAAGRDVDLEWVYDGKSIHWLQVRGITSIGGLNVYSSRMAREMSPGMIAPLVGSVVVPLHSRVWAGIIREVAGETGLDERRLTKTFHFRIYHNLSEFGKIFAKLGMPVESLEMMMGVVPPGAGKPSFKPGPRIVLLLPRLLRFLADRWTFASKLESIHPRLDARARAFPLDPPDDLDGPRLLEAIDRLNDLNLEMTFYTINAILLMLVHAGMLRSRLKKAGIDFEAFDLTEGMDELDLYDPVPHLAALHRSFGQLPEEARATIAGGDDETFLRLEGIDAFKSDVRAFLERFGHMSDTTGHFGSIPWRETPGIVLGLIAGHKAPESRKGPKIALGDLERSGRAGRRLKWLVRRSRRFRLLRDRFSSLFTYSIMLYRVYYLAVGRRLVRAGVLKGPEDIYFLQDDEIRAIVAGGFAGRPPADLVAQRKKEMESSRGAVLPEIIFGEDIPPAVREIGDKLKGTPTSKGYYTGPAKVVRSVGEFAKLEPGDVLVIPYSDVSWTPLFARAGAVVAESGGILSHSSIIAREYGIPAVVSAKGALELPDGAAVTVDGFKGEVLVHQNPISTPNRTDIGG